MFYVLPMAGLTALYYAIVYRNATAALIAAILYGDALFPAGTVRLSGVSILQVSDKSVERSH